MEQWKRALWEASNPLLAVKAAAAAGDIQQLEWQVTVLPAKEVTAAAAIEAVEARKQAVAKWAAERGEPATAATALFIARTAMYARVEWQSQWVAEIEVDLSDAETDVWRLVLDATVANSVPTLDWLQRQTRQIMWAQRMWIGMMRCAAERNNLQVMKWLMTQGHIDTAAALDALVAAIENGRVAARNLLEARGYATAEMCQRNGYRVVKMVASLRDGIWEEAANWLCSKELNWAEVERIPSVASSLARWREIKRRRRQSFMTFVLVERRRRTAPRLPGELWAMVWGHL